MPQDCAVTINDPFMACVGKSRSQWLRGVIDKLKVGAKLLILGNRRSGKTTILERLHLMRTIEPRDRFILSAFSVDSHCIEKFEIFCKSPFHKKLKVAMIDDIDCFSGGDLKVIRRCLRTYEHLCFVITTSTISGLNESTVSQCNILHLLSPQKKDIESIVGSSNDIPVGISIGCAINIHKANELIKSSEAWSVRCSVDKIINASLNPTCVNVRDAIAEASHLIRNGWTCGDVIETLHMELASQRWEAKDEVNVTKVLLKYATLADKPDSPSLLLYTFTLELSTIRSGAGAQTTILP